MKDIKECPLLLLVLFSTIFLIGLKIGGKVETKNVYIENVSASAIGIVEQLKNNKQVDAVENVGRKEESLDSMNASLSENEVIQTYELSAVKEDYFADALFIGDSRTDGLRDYSKNLGGATFYAKVGLTIQNLLSSPMVEVENETENISLEEALNRYSFGKIYVMVGINELGRGTPETFFADYAKVIARIRQLQPKAIIFVEAIMKVSEEKTTTDPIFNNANINVRNEAIRTLENKQDIFYLDMNEAVTDENGNLKKEYSFDGVHLKAIHYSVWENFLKANGVLKK